MKTVTFRKCDRCGRAKTTALVTFKQNISYVFQRQQKEFYGRVCLRCMTETFAKFELLTLIGTWWGIIGSLVGPVFILSNLDEYICSTFQVIRASASLRWRSCKVPKSRPRMQTVSDRAAQQLTSHQEELVKKFFLAITLLDQTENRFDANRAKRILYNCVTTDIIKPDVLDDLTNIDPDAKAKWKIIFQRLAWYSAREKLSNKLSSLIAACLFVFAMYQFVQSEWVWGLGVLALVPVGKFGGIVLFSVIFTPRFSPLALGLTHTECRFACDEIVGHPRWND